MPIRKEGTTRTSQVVGIPTIVDIAFAAAEIFKDFFQEISIILLATDASSIMTGITKNHELGQTTASIGIPISAIAPEGVSKNDRKQTLRRQCFCFSGFTEIQQDKY